MTSKNKKKLTNSIYKYLPVYLFAVLIILLSIVNINNYLLPTKENVLGAKTVNHEGIYWYAFLKKNPSYIPGWLEIERTDRVYKLNPNYEIK